jgi:hypothetical protein
MARNATAVLDPFGQYADWIEFYNDGMTRIDLSGYSISLDSMKTNPWWFPQGVSIAGRSYLILWCDSSRSGSLQNGPPLNSGQSLPGAGGAIYLWGADGQQVDSVDYGFQLEDLSVGRMPDVWRLLSAPTLGKANSDLQPTDPVAALRFNEWMANPSSGSDWFELYNPGLQPVALAGCLLTNAVPQPGSTMFVISDLSYIAAGGWELFYADKKTTNGKDHVSFSLSKQGGSLWFYDPQRQPVDHIDYLAQDAGVSEGRLPDGNDTIVRFSQTDTPGDSNYLPMTHVWINEILAHTDPPLEDAIEFYNPMAQPVDMSGWYLSNTPNHPQKYRLSEGSILLPYGFLVLYESQFKGTNDFTFNSAHGDKAILSAADAAGLLTGYRAEVAFGSTANGVSVGRFESSQKVEFVAMDARSFGADAPLSLTEFRKGRGKANPYPRVGPVVITEIIYHPPDAWTTNDVDGMNYEFIELQNLTGAAVSLYDPEHLTNTWRIEGEVKLDLPQGLRISAQGFLLLVGFDPDNDAAALTKFRQHYPNLPLSVKLVGPYQGKLANNEGRIALYQPDPPQELPHPDAGYVPYILVDQVKYSDQSPWPVTPDGQGHSLQRMIASDYGDDVVNWRASLPNPGQDNRIAVPDQDRDGMSDVWENQQGFSSADASDALQDADGDGRSNGEEFLSGSDPHNPADYLKLDSVHATEGVVSLGFKARAGQTYTVEFREAGTSLSWQRLMDLGARFGDQDGVVRDRMPSPKAARIYRLATPRIP